MGMGLFTYGTIKTLVIVHILFTGPAFALTKTNEVSEDVYERQQHEYVLYSRNEVAAYCDAGDVLVSGECEGKAESLLPVPNNTLNSGPKDYFERMIYIDSKEV